MSVGTSSVRETEIGRPVIVQKYGGSSVADVEKIGRVADSVVAAKQAGNDVVVVVSAMGKTTDSLIALAHSVTNVNGSRSEPARRELDMLVSTGERVSMSLLSIAIQARGYHAISFTGSQSGILTNDRHFDARIIEVRPHRIEDELSRGSIVIVAGYQGMSYKREITTLGRGGSDTTAVALAAALEADRCEIYSDVDGVYSADPRVVPEAKHLPELDHAILQEMAEAGAKVVCAQAVEWARKRNIVIHARSTFDRSKETIVAPPGTKQLAGARAVTGEAKISFLSWSGVSSSSVVEGLQRAGLAYKDLALAGDRGSAIIPLLNVPSADKAHDALRAALPHVEISNDVATVSVVGDGLAGDGTALGQFVAALTEAQATPRALSAGPLRITAVIPADRSAEAQRAIHHVFVK
ncbi:MAG: aspartate kinase [Polyangiaceae bacterium]|nr:aspartate kinase [Polyangiaceae bacterium]